MESELCYMQACYKFYFDLKEIYSFKEGGNKIFNADCYEFLILLDKNNKYYFSIFKNKECLTKDQVLYLHDVDKYGCNLKITNKYLDEFNELCDIINKFILLKKLSR